VSQQYKRDIVPHEVEMKASFVLVDEMGSVLQNPSLLGHFLTLVNASFTRPFLYNS